MQAEIPPFSLNFSENVPALLKSLGCSISISTYQAGKVIFLSSDDGVQLVQMARNFRKPMGIAIQGKKLAIATLGEVLVLRNEEELAANYPPQPGRYDALFMPRVSYHTSRLDIHDIAWGKKGLWAVNTQFSCLALVSPDYSFDPQWQPHFISELIPDDRCHLNGLAMVEGEPMYVTALGHEDIAESWRKTKANGGVLMHVPDNEIVVGGLPMPHSPRVYDGEVYVLLSALGQLAKVDPANGRVEVLAHFAGLARGMSRMGDYLFIGLSKIRKSSKGFQDLPIAQTASQAGVVIFNLKTGKSVGEMVYLRSVDEIYDVRILPNTCRPNIVTPDKEVAGLAITSQEHSFWKVPKEAKD